MFIIYASSTATVEPATCSKIDTDIVLILQKNAKAFVTSKFRGDEIFEVNGETQRVWIEILNKSYNEHIKINRNSVLGFVVIEPKYLSFKHETTKAKKKKEKILPKTWSYWNSYRYNFAYAGRDVVNQAAKVVPGVIKQATNDIDIDIDMGGEEIEHVLPKILCEAIEDVYKAPSRLLGNFGKQQFNKIKRKILR